MQPRVAGLRVVLCALDPALARAYAQVAEAVGDWVSGGQGSILDLEADALVSPANSFGFMDGGLDALYADRFGPALQDAARAAVLHRHDGELLVGDADLVPTADPAVPYVVLAPTMRVPVQLPPDTVNPYLAMRAVLRLVERGVVADGPDAGRPVRDVVRTVAVPGLGTGVGRVGAATCARQVRAALEGACGPITLPRSWADASFDHQALYTDTPGRIQPRTR
ncbi:macro domain-containing protein [Kineosporia sp. R_H_3]|uniref:macro domain-containing protein n=1 Tax=Kineosporia sp. R_H_3 TaxID=1961848 RepID=UPI0018E914A0|nr:macro domain-containing protein [Kineosporia sp. R_H_3]